MLYTGVTNDLERRVFEHKHKINSGFTKKYNIFKLVYFEDSGDVNAAIAREKQLKGLSRQKKNDLVERTNPNWEDLSTAW